MCVQPYLTALCRGRDKLRQMHNPWLLSPLFLLLISTYSGQPNSAELLVALSYWHFAFIVFFFAVNWLIGVNFLSVCRLR